MLPILIGMCVRHRHGCLLPQPNLGLGVIDCLPVGIAEF
jgi:hypothetical protein